MGSTVGTCFISGKGVETDIGVEAGLGVETGKGFEVGVNSVVETSFSEQDMKINNEIRSNKNLYNIYIYPISKFWRRRWDSNP